MSDRNLAKNTVFYSAALAGQKVLSFIYFIFLARAIGVESQGKFSIALSFTSIFAMFLDLGLTQILIRETAKNKQVAGGHLANIIGFKLLASAAVYLAIVSLVNIMGYPALTKQLVYISGFVMLLDSLSLSVYGAIRGHQNLFFESAGTIINQLVVMSIGLIGLRLGWSLPLLMGIYLIGSLVNFMWSSVNLRRSFGVKTTVRFNRPLTLLLLKMSIPFAIAGIFVRIYSSTDVILLSKISGDWAVGIYSVAFKVAFALQFIALAFSASLFPAFSHYFANSKENLAKLFSKSMYWLIFASLPLATGVITIADKMIAPVFGEQYAASVVPLKILAASIFFVFLCFPVGALLNACSRQGRHTVHLGLTAVFSLLANLLLIPWLSYNGAAIANFLSYLFLFGMDFYVVNRMIDYDRKALIAVLLKSLLACLIMGAAVWWLKGYFHFLIVIPSGVAIYLLVAYLLKLYSLKSIREFLPALIKR